MPSILIVHSGIFFSKDIFNFFFLYQQNYCFCWALFSLSCGSIVSRIQQSLGMDKRFATRASSSDFVVGQGRKLEELLISFKNLFIVIGYRDSFC